MDRDVRSADDEALVADDAHADIVDDDDVEELPQSDPAEEARADEFERQVQAEAMEQFKRLKDDAQAIYGLTRGRVGVRSPEEWAALLEKAGDEIGNGRFIVRCLGAERYLDPEVVAVLITLRQNLMSELPFSTAAEVMKIDAAIIGYYNMLRTQRWIGDLSLVVEREAFGEEPLNEIHGPELGRRLEKELSRLAEVMLPLQERSARMMMRSLEALRPGQNTSNRNSTSNRRKERLTLSPAR